MNNKEKLKKKNRKEKKKLFVQCNSALYFLQINVNQTISYAEHLMHPIKS